MTKDEFATLCLQCGNDFISLHKTNGEILRANVTAKKVIGYLPKELIGKNFYDFCHTENRQFIEKIGQLPPLNGKSVKVPEYQFIAKDNSLVWLESEFVQIKNKRGDVTEILTITRNIDAIKQKLALLQKTEVLWDEAGTLAQLGVWELDLTTMTPVWSKAIFDMLEVPYDKQPSFDELINFYAEEARPEMKKMLAAAINEGKAWNKKLPFVTAKGNRVWVHSISRPEVRFGKIIKLYGVFQNITEQIETRDRQKDLIDQLTSQKTKLQEFNQIVSHNLRSPVASLNFLLDFYEKADTVAEKEEIFNNIKLASQSLNSLLDDLVNAVKIISSDIIDVKEVNLISTVKNIEKMLEGSFKQLNAEITIDAGAWETVNYPKIYFDSILLNLISNALKYHSPERTPKIKITTLLENEKKVLKIADNGLGINLDRYKDKIFKLHKTFHRERPGKGLGLFMTKNQIDATGGEISLESEEGKGTTFTILFKDF